MKVGEILTSMTQPPYNRRTTDGHEAKMYSGGYPEVFKIDSAALADNLVEGNNLIAIQVHNESSGSLDLSSNFYLIAGMNQPGETYQQVPSFFNQMMNWYSSNLPLIVIDTYGEYIPDEPKISGWMKIYHRDDGQRNSIFDEPLEYNGPLAIEQRGYSSRYMYEEDGKISYSLETQDSLGENNNVRIFDMPKENDWVLYGPYSDKTMLKNVMAYWIGNQTGAWAPRTQYVDVILNGKQMGIFAFMEKIKRDDDRVDIARLDEDDIAADSLTGGYIVKVDRNTSNPLESWDSPYPPNNAIDQVVSWVMVYPRWEVAPKEQLAYIKEYITGFETLMNSPGFADPVSGYRSILDVPSFVDFFLIGELFRDADSFRSSMFLHKDRDDKDPLLKMGPLWDFNYSMSNYDVCGCASSSGWAYQFNHYCNERYKINPFWWEKLAEDPYFHELAVDRWEELREHILSEENIGEIGTSSSQLSGEKETLTCTVYPNPIIHFATLRLENAGPGLMEVQVWSLDGKLIKSTQHSLGYQGTWLFPVKPDIIGTATAGQYLISIRMNGKQIAEKQVFVR